MVGVIIFANRQPGHLVLPLIWKKSLLVVGGLKGVSIDSGRKLSYFSAKL